MRRTTRPAMLRRDLTAAVVAFAIVFATGFIAGRAFLPRFAETLASVDVESADVSDTQAPPALDVQFAAMEAPAALMEANGAVQGRLVLDQGELGGRNFFAEHLEDDEGLITDLNVRFTGGDSVLTIIADGMRDREHRTEGMTVVLTTDGMMFNPRAGMCTLELSELTFDVVRRPWGQEAIPRFQGSLVCDEVPELRSGDLVSFSALFGYQGH